MLCQDPISNAGLWYVIFWLAGAFIPPIIGCIIYIAHILKRYKCNQDIGYIEVSYIPQNPYEEQNKLIDIYNKLSISRDFNVLTNDEWETLKEHDLI